LQSNTPDAETCPAGLAAEESQAGCTDSRFTKSRILEKYQNQRF